MAEHLEARFGVRIEVVVNEGEGRLRSEVENELQRIAQEGMNNAVKHAHASVIQVRCDVHVRTGRSACWTTASASRPADRTRTASRSCVSAPAAIGANLQLSDTGSGTLLEVTLGHPIRHRSSTTSPLEGSTHP